MTAHRERPGDRKRRLKQIVVRLRKEFPQASTALEFRDPYQLLIATILSAQCTDERVNKVTPALFAKYPGPVAMAAAIQEEVEGVIRSTGFFRNKAKNIIACSKAIVETHGGQVPNVLEKLVSLPGVGRKTAHCVMGGAFGINSGVVVDTHVQRLAGRLGLTNEVQPEKIELDLMEHAPRDTWYELSNLLILHGRTTCDARKPDCASCVVLKLCPSGPTFLSGHKPPTKREVLAPKTNPRKSIAGTSLKR